MKKMKQKKKTFTDERKNTMLKTCLTIRNIFSSSIVALHITLRVLPFVAEIKVQMLNLKQKLIMEQKVENKQSSRNDGNTVLCAGAVSKDGISLIHGDSLQALRSYGDNHFKVAIVDPPYGINAGKMTMGSGKHKFSKDKDWDSAIPTAEYFAELFRVSENQIVWGGNYFTEHLPPTPHWLLWDKKNPNLSFAEGELAWVRKGKNLRIFKHYSAMVEEGGKIHPTQKPVKLYRWVLDNYTSEGDLILDTHLGSGSIAIACHQMKRNLIAYEIDAEYYEKACKRFEEQTRQMALW